MSLSEFESHLARTVAPVDARLADWLATDSTSPRLIAAMRHAALAGGKRLRPYLVVESARLIAASIPDGAISAAAALECVHCYSLVHDDLPAMDDDDLRRGQPTVHRAFDEATAILAGDALLTLAFEKLADPATHADGAIRAALVLDLARAAGQAGMVGGQMLDLAAEGRFDGTGPLTLTEADIRHLQALKTGALIRVACQMGARIAGAAPADFSRLTRYGEILGLAFQLADDLLDVTGDAAVVGKAVAKDEGRGKGTLVQLKGIDATRTELSSLVREAGDILAPFGPAADPLIEAARFVAERRR